MGITKFDIISLDFEFFTNFVIRLIISETFVSMNSFLSDKALPKGLLIPTVIQIKMTPGEKSTIIRLNLNLEDCPDCDFLEYACVCEHHEHEEKPAAKPKK